MAIFRCKMCGGILEFEQGASVGVCESCGTKQTLPRLDDERRVNLYDRANHFRRNNEFDKAAGIYEQILSEDNTDAEAYWSLVLCRYGIEYVEDPATHKRVPTINRAQYTSIFDDENYKLAIQYADISQKILYEEEAATINEIQKGILAISQKEEPFDIFICYKETDPNGRRTPDSVLANDLYHQLTTEGFKVFFSRITLEDKLGIAYEPYIFAALNSAKVMVVLGTKAEYFNAVWVKNEWSRYLTIVKQSGGKKVLIPAYRDMDPYDLPEEFSHLQAQDMSKLGFMQDLIRGIKKIINSEETKVIEKESVFVNSGSVNSAPLLRRAFLFLEDGEWEKADEFCEQVLNIEPENAQAYLGKLMAELHVYRMEDLENLSEPFDRSNNYKKILRFGDSNLISTMEGYIVSIRERNENARLTEIYNHAVYVMQTAQSESDFKKASAEFNSIPGFHDSDVLSTQCLDKAEETRKNAIYSDAVKKMNSCSDESGYKSVANRFHSISGFKDADELEEKCLDRAEVTRKQKIYEYAKSHMYGSISNYQMAIGLFNTISGWRDVEDQISFCYNKIEEIKANEEKERIRVIDEEQKRKKKKKRNIILILSFALSTIIIVFVCFGIVIPSIKKAKYIKAQELVDKGQYLEAVEIFEHLGKREESKDAKNRYLQDLISQGSYQDALSFADENKLLSVKEKNELARKNIIKNGKYDYLLNANVGDIISFGESDGTKIDWIVLDKDKDKMLLITQNVTEVSIIDGTNWSDSNVRYLLNNSMGNSYYEMMFTKDEQFLISKTTLKSDEYIYNKSLHEYILNPIETEDYLFLLSTDEVERYFPNQDERSVDYSEVDFNQADISKEYLTASMLNINNRQRWALRDKTPSGYWSVVTKSGKISSLSAANGVVYIRPALWIDL